MTSSYALSAWFFTRALCLIYVVAFLSLATQARGLWGSKGLLPVSNYLQAVEQAVGPTRYVQVPSLFWISSSDTMLTAAAVLGVLASVAALFGFAQGWMLLLCYVLYLSFVAAGQDFLSFQWDALLLEAGFLVLFAVPWSFAWLPATTYDPHWAVRFLFYAILFKLMFLSGVVKLLSGDTSWRDLSALSYHFWTQPLPNPVSPFMHALPMWVHKVSTFLTFVIELAVPFLIFWPRARLVAAAAFLILSAFIFVTGNYTFFNLLTGALCFWLIPDVWWQKLLDKLSWEVAMQDPAVSLNPAAAGVFGILALLSLYWCTRFLLPDAVHRLVHPVLRYTQAFHISNSYGLFANMTKTRPEIVIEGSNDGENWKEYEFKYKPGDLTRRPPVIEPFQPRLDWQMWFAALGAFRDSPFVYNLMVRLLEGAPETLAFFSHNPFAAEPPRFIRARLYEYKFTSPSEIFQEGKWWNRELMGDFSPVYQRQ